MKNLDLISVQWLESEENFNQSANYSLFDGRVIEIVPFYITWSKYEHNKIGTYAIVVSEVRDRI